MLHRARTTLHTLTGLAEMFDFKLIGAISSEAGWGGNTQQGTLQCIRKVFRPLDFFQILFRYSLTLKWIKYMFILILHTIMQNDKAKTKFAHSLKINNIKTLVT
jgi:hypothetical protein